MLKADYSELESNLELTKKGLSVLLGKAFFGLNSLDVIFDKIYVLHTELHRSYLPPSLDEYPVDDKK